MISSFGRFLAFTMLLCAAATTLGRGTSALQPRTEFLRANPLEGHVLSLAPLAQSGVVFGDAMKQAAPWFSARPLRLDADGNVSALERGQTAETHVFVNQAYPAGEYRLDYDGTGRIEIDPRSGSVLESVPGRMRVRIFSNGGYGIRLRLVATDPRSYVRNVRFLLPGFTQVSDEPAFRPLFLRYVASFAAVRFERWMPVDRAWATRPTPRSATQAGGVAIEYAIALANATGTIPWFTIPAGADDDYVRRFATLVAQRLDARMEPIFEYGDDGNRFGVRDAGREARALSLVGTVFAATGRRVATVAAGSLASGALARSLRIAPHLVPLPEASLAPAMRTNARSQSTALDAYGKAVLASGPAAYYRLDDANATALDASPNGLNGTLGSRVETGLASIIGSTAASAMGFPGSAQKAGVVYVAPTPKLQPSAAVSMEMFLRFATEPANFTVPASYGTDAVFAPYDLYFTRGGVLNAQFNLTTGVLVVTDPAPLETDTNYDVVSTFDGATGRLYVNGVAVASNTRAGTLDGYDRAHGLAIGDDAGFSDPAFAGTIQAVAIYTKALPSTDVTEHYRVSVGKSSSPPPGVDWLTYHGNASRTGWNAAETVLDTTTVSSGKFTMLESLPVDGQVYAEPLVATKETVPGIGVHDLLVVATANDSVYAYDAQSGAAIWHRTFANPAAGVVPVPATDTGCTNVSPRIGIMSTPVIDRSNDTIYVVAATDERSGSSTATHIRLHAISLANGAENASADIAGTYPQSGGATIAFVPKLQMNRASLLEYDGDIYVAFGSHCDFGGTVPHGWLFAFDAKSLARAKNVFLTTADPSTDGKTLGSIWGSGFGPSADASGNVYVATGNGALYDGSHNLTQSVLKISPGLAFPQISSFTPNTQAQENQRDLDLASSGVMLLPDQPGKVPHLAVAGGKTGITYLLNRDSLGGYAGAGSDAAAWQGQTNGGLWGAPVYFVAADGKPYIIYCGGNDPVRKYRLNVNPVSLTLSSRSTAAIGSTEGGTIPIVSSNGTAAGSAVVWALSRPAGTSTPIKLKAYDGADLSRLLYTGDTHPWTNADGDALLAPTVVNGKVYVPTGSTVDIFGLSSAAVKSRSNRHVLGASVTRATQATRATQTTRRTQGARVPAAEGAHEISGIVSAILGDTLVIRLRDGRSILVDATQAKREERVTELFISRRVSVHGHKVSGIFKASAISRARDDAATWPPDR
jgi:hypothetical protein